MYTQPNSQHSHREHFACYSAIELREILGAYSAGVAAGVWTDYGVDLYTPQTAVVRFYRGAKARPLFRVVKTVKHSGAQFLIFSQRERIRHYHSHRDVVAFLHRYTQHNVRRKHLALRDA